MAHLVVEQRVDRQHGSLQQSSLQIRWHSRLAREHSLKPKARSVPADRLAEAKTLSVRCLHRVRQRDRDWLLNPDGRKRSGRLRGLLILRLGLDDRAEIWAEPRTLRLVKGDVGAVGVVALARWLLRRLGPAWRLRGHASAVWVTGPWIRLRAALLKSARCCATPPAALRDTGVAKLVTGLRQRILGLAGLRRLTLRQLTL
jgi:hypothetical protein